jgi:hypothetical protein
MEIGFLEKTQAKIHLLKSIFKRHPYLCVGYLYCFWYAMLNVKKMKLMDYYVQTCPNVKN